MALPKHLRSALLTTAVILPFLSQVSSTTSSSSSSVVFSTCIDSCIGNGACGIGNPRCMCKAARGSFLDNVLVCMYHHCTGEVRSAEALFLHPMEAGCASIDKPIPESSIDEAERVLSTLIARLPEATSETTTTTTIARLTPITTPTTTPQQSRITLQEPTTESETKPTETRALGSSADDRAPTTAVASQPPARTTTPVTRASSQSSTKTKPAPNTDPTDSSPFATPPDSAAGRGMGPSYLWAGLPLAIAVALR
ncbi:hypothetical protein QBC33DRAFT_556309 [Phialemonium atrogriseum]|uniref:Extracellular membrane protein CFEM domain-containing protein n=1 Tax=Phialemonium atrogriseum TaxID=1093897 RepID=A0AAJ0FP50_9PEZI|nr:uncharacterized protein QBC33DRAFT_556309 [Phialemonium atrogriseum]KAK1769888.1 hypothetical protein QBC33DRAFT_556309 [Phialemonium atrogriseum]